jgi:polar amino acid transport system substrate-binding protein/arginine/ornithine transport system substrate-binding protein
MSSFNLVTLSRRTVAVIGMLLGLACAGVAFAQEKLRIATEGAYPPWSFVDAQGKLQGWDVDVANALCSRMKIQCEIMAQDWDGIIPSLLAKKYDVIVASMAMTPARRERVAFSDKYKDVISQFVTRKGTVTDTSPSGLKGKRIGVQRGSAQHKWLEVEGYDKSADLKLYEKTTDAELDLVAGRVDAIIGNKLTMYVGFFKKPEAKDFDYVGPELKGGVFGDGAGIALRKEDTALVQRVNKALQEIRADGTYETISRKYFPFKLL